MFLQSRIIKCTAYQTYTLTIAPTTDAVLMGKTGWINSGRVNTSM